MQKLLSALKKIIDLLEKSGERWVLSGSVSLWFYGVNTEPGDIDILTTDKGVDYLYKKLKDRCIRPPEYSSSEHFRSYYAIFEIDGIKVEVFSRLEQKIENGWYPLYRRLNSRVMRIKKNLRVYLPKIEDLLYSYGNSSREKDREKYEKLKNIVLKEESL